MGEMADLEIARMEIGTSWVKDKKTGKVFEVDNSELMYGSTYDSPRYQIVEDCSE